MGRLKVQRIRNEEVFSFEYDDDWIKSSDQIFFLDPHLGFYKGKQYLPEEKRNFGIFMDSAPDRWGRLLMQRKEAWQASIEGKKERTLLESDFLLGVYDGHRQGGLRFKINPDGAFLDNHSKMATPPWTSLRELEHASLQLEKEDGTNSPEYSKWLNMLINPGSSLGGARPKASVMDTEGHLWIAKFPSIKDVKNNGAWEMTLNHLARACGIEVPETRLQKFTGNHHTFLSRRFDRTNDQKRIHFASAMTMLGKTDGTDSRDGVGYLDLAEIIIKHSCESSLDLEQLWRRMLFNILVSNTDDHLRNHGFLLSSKGWRLAPAYDMNPNEFGNGLTLNVSVHSNEQQIPLAISTAVYYRIKKTDAEKILLDMKKKISDWRTVAKKTGISNNEIEKTKRAFRLAEDN